MNTTTSFEDMKTPEEHSESSDRGPWSNKWHPTWSKKEEQKAQDEASQAEKSARTSSSGEKERFDEDRR